ncbi:universal stress protein [Tunturiibacter gelidiferens]|uniref:universal stress protein n=1 Tax=Tunturiibacter gelidiferens TaxID=3069689 RepID=UPI003D9BD775
MPTSMTGSALSFSKVLLATDFSPASQAAFQVALRVCTELRASLSILHVLEDPYVPSSGPGGQFFELDSISQADRRSLDSLREAAQLAGVPCEANMVNGTASLAILEAISTQNADLVVLGTSALHGFERLVFGSTAEAILREAPCPVLTVGPQVSQSAMTSHSEGPIVFATDFHRTTTHAIRYAKPFCVASKSPLHCLHVLPRALESNSPNQIVPMIMTEALHHVATESGTTIRSPICAVTYGSEISNAVVEYAKQHKAKLIVLGVRRASMLASHVQAHITYRIITEAPCPVLTICFASEQESTQTAA